MFKYIPCIVKLKLKKLNHKTIDLIKEQVDDTALLEPNDKVSYPVLESSLWE